MKITKEDLNKVVAEVIKNSPELQKLKEERRKQQQTLKESGDYMAGRQVIISAQQASLDFESEIIKTLDLVAPDDLHPNLRRRFNDIVEEMKDDIVAAVKRAVEQLAPFPRTNDENKPKATAPATPVAPPMAP